MRLKNYDAPCHASNQTPRCVFVVCVEFDSQRYEENLHSIVTPPELYSTARCCIFHVSDFECENMKFETRSFFPSRTTELFAH